MSSNTYLAYAARERTAASKTTLLNRRAMHERSAEVWEEMARNADATAAMAEVNLQAKFQ
jgi:hypothetical protein